MPRQYLWRRGQRHLYGLQCGYLLSRQFCRAGDLPGWVLLSCHRPNCGCRASVVSAWVVLQCNGNARGHSVPCSHVRAKHGQHVLHSVSCWHSVRHNGDVQCKCVHSRLVRAIAGSFGVFALPSRFVVRVVGSDGEHSMCGWIVRAQWCVIMPGLPQRCHLSPHGSLESDALPAGRTLCGCRSLGLHTDAMHGGHILSDRTIGCQRQQHVCTGK